MTAEELTNLYSKTCDKVLPYLLLEGPREHLDPTTEKGKKILSKCVKNFRIIVAHDPNHWQSYWMMGKALQALKQYEDSYQSLLLAHKKELTQHDVMRELALECLCTSRYDQSVYYCQAAIEFQPDDITLWSNMSVSQLFKGSLEEAEKWANKTLAAAPTDSPSLAVLWTLKKTKTGEIPLPKDFLEWEGKMVQKNDLND